jgi:hypothetical protein
MLHTSNLYQLLGKKRRKHSIAKSKIVYLQIDRLGGKICHEPNTLERTFELLANFVTVTF